MAHGVRKSTGFQLRSGAELARVHQTISGCAALVCLTKCYKNMVNEGCCRLHNEDVVGNRRQVKQFHGFKE
jgi:hypothetical protein